MAASGIGPAIDDCTTTSTACWYCMLVLLYLFNPIVTSLRNIQQASELKNVQRKLGYPQASLDSLSESKTVFDFERLKEIIEKLEEQLEPLDQDKRLADIKPTITLVDGSALAALPQMMEALWRKAEQGSGLVQWRLHAHFEILRGIPTRIDVTPNGGGEHVERAVLNCPRTRAPQPPQEFCRHVKQAHIRKCTCPF